APRSRVVYIDNDPIVHVHADALLSSGPRGSVTFMEADLREPGNILRGAAAGLDLRKPVGLMLIGVLHCIPDDENPAGIVARLLGGLASGSYLVLAHPASDIHTRQTGAAASRFNQLAEQGVTLRSR